MKLSKRSCVFFIVVVLAIVAISAAQTKAPAAKAALTKVENTDPGLRMKWYDQHLDRKSVV